MGKTQVNYRIDEDLLEQIKEAAKKENVSYTQWIINLCKKELSSNDESSKTEPKPGTNNLEANLSSELYSGLSSKLLKELQANLSSELSSEVQAIEDRLFAKLSSKIEEIKEKLFEEMFSRYSELYSNLYSNLLSTNLDGVGKNPETLQQDQPETQLPYGVIKDEDRNKGEHLDPDNKVEGSQTSILGGGSEPFSEHLEPSTLDQTEINQSVSNQPSETNQTLVEEPSTPDDKPKEYIRSYNDPNSRYENYIPEDKRDYCFKNAQEAFDYYKSTDVGKSHVFCNTLSKFKKEFNYTRIGSVNTFAGIYLEEHQKPNRFFLLKNP